MKINEYHFKKLKTLQNNIGIFFKNINTLYISLQHSSYYNEKGNRSNNKSVPAERFEFLGDAVLELVVSKYLFKKYNNVPEGKLTKLRSKIVNGKTLYTLANKIKLSKYIILSKGEERCGGRNREGLLSDFMEALIGAIYIDRGLGIAEKFIKKYILKDIDKVINSTDFIDSKSVLQEYIQKKYKIIPKYRVKKVTGKEHCRKYNIELTVHNNIKSHGKGNSIKEAEKQAATAMLKQLNLL